MQIFIVFLVFTAMNVCIFYNLYTEKEIVVNKFLHLSANRDNGKNEVKCFLNRSVY